MDEDDKQEQIALLTADIERLSEEAGSLLKERKRVFDKRAGLQLQQAFDEFVHEFLTHGATDKAAMLSYALGKEITDARQKEWLGGFG
jgi:hypothetical protein